MKRVDKCKIENGKKNIKRMKRYKHKNKMEGI